MTMERESREPYRSVSYVETSNHSAADTPTRARPVIGGSNEPISPALDEEAKMKRREAIRRAFSEQEVSKDSQLSDSPRRLRISTDLSRSPAKEFARCRRENSECDLTDTESSLPSTREPSSLFVYSGTTSMSSVNSEFVASQPSYYRPQQSPPSPTPCSAHATANRPSLQFHNGDPSPLKPLRDFLLPARRNTNGSETSFPTTSPTTSSRLPNRNNLSYNQQRNSVEKPRSPDPFTIEEGIVQLDQQQSEPCPEGVSPRGTFGVDLEPLIIAHDTNVQTMMDELKISYGVQYELARGVSIESWQWSDVTKEKLRLLTGPAAKAAQNVKSVMRDEIGSSAKNSPSNLMIWQELDREQKAIVENKSRGLGLLGDWEGAPNWYGGRVQQIARLIEDPERKSFHIRLEPLEMRSSNRFARFLGSRRIIQLRVSQTLLYKAGESARAFLGHKFVLCGRIFVPFHAKDSVYMVETNENFERLPDSACGDQFRMSFEEFLHWHNPFDRNWRQLISKWTTRWALGVSTSIPVLEFEGENMYYIDDVYAENWNGLNNPEHIMTDGCGFVNGAALMRISRIRNLPHRPTAVQGRIAGAKGLWILHPRDRDPKEAPKIWIRKSQRKIDLGPFSELPRPHRIFDLVAPSRTHTPDRLSMQCILCMSHNGVPDDAFVSFMRDSLQEEVQKLTDWTRPSAMVFLLHAISNAGNVGGVRMQRQALGAARALGLTGRTYGRKDDETRDGDDGNSFDDLTTSGRNSYSGEPFSLHEVAFELVQAGFHPAELQLLYDKIRYVLEFIIKDQIQQFHFPIPQSARAFIIPDPCGVLREGEIYFRSSEPLKDIESDTYFDTLTGDVIVGRNPMSVPSDMQKVKAVNYSELSSYYDVAIFPTKGPRSLQSLLSGGDSDGDEALIIWAPQVTSTFSNASLVSKPKDFESDNFDRDVSTVVEFWQHLATRTNQEAQKEFQKILLSGLSQTFVGLYSILHDVALYTYGYSDRRTVRLAHMFETLLDAAKSGLQVKDHILRQDKREYDRSRPRCMDQADRASLRGNSMSPKRDPALGDFVLDILVKAGDLEQGRHLIQYDSLWATGTQEKPDGDLTKPHGDALQRAGKMANTVPILMEELKAIEAHVENLHRPWKLTRCDLKTLGRVSLVENRGRPKINKKRERLVELMKQFAEDVPSVFVTQNVLEIKASYAYKLAPAYGFAMAFRELCAIKARARGQGPITQDILETMRIPTSSLRALAQNTEF